MKSIKNIKTALLLLTVFIVAVPSFAQLKGDHLLGDAGLQSGTQAPASLSILVPVYNYHTSTFKKTGGGEINAASINMFVTGVGASLVSPLKILNANWGVSILVPFASNKIDGSLVTSKSSLAFSDIFLEPIQLGWKLKKADIVAGYALYIPTGKYEQGGSDNSGLGMLSNEFSGGITLYMDPKKEYNISTLLSYAINGEKKNTNGLKTGNVLSIEGGLGKTFYKKIEGSPIPRILNAGLVYYMQFKTSDDKIPVGNTVFTGSGDHIYALGAEFNAFMPKIHSSIILRWLGELGASNRFQGNTLFITLVPYMKFLMKKTGG